jgi:hypothetical protein
MFQSHSALPQQFPLHTNKFASCTVLLDLGLAKHVQSTANDKTSLDGLQHCASNETITISDRCTSGRAPKRAPVSTLVQNLIADRQANWRRVFHDGIMIASDLLWHLRVAAQNLTAFLDNRARLLQMSCQLLHRSVD